MSQVTDEINLTEVAVHKAVIVISVSQTSRVISRAVIVVRVPITDVIPARVMMETKLGIPPELKIGGVIVKNRVIVKMSVRTAREIISYSNVRVRVPLIVVRVVKRIAGRECHPRNAR